MLRDTHLGERCYRVNPRGVWQSTAALPGKGRATIDDFRLSSVPEQASVLVNNAHHPKGQNHAIRPGRKATNGQPSQPCA